MSDLRDVFRSAAAEYCEWAETFDPERTTIGELVSALGVIFDKAPLRVLRWTERPDRPRFFKPNARWQADRRKAARLPLDGYRTAMLPNDDGTPDTQCSLAYDIADFYELLTAKAPDADLIDYLKYVCWGYANVRLHAARQALLAPSDMTDPFACREIGGRRLRFVSWRTNALSHASEDLMDVRGASTLCGGRLAFHKHTQQQWSCHACGDCRAIADGVEPETRGVSRSWRSSSTAEVDLPGAIRLDAQIAVVQGAARIAPYKCPRAIEFVAELPRTQTGKLQRFKLRTAAEATT